MSSGTEVAQGLTGKQRMGRPVSDRFWSKVVRDPDTECWEWTASTTSNGYGQVWTARRGVLVHRFAYELLVGPIPEGLTIDHLCRVRRCVNPAHMEPVTGAENTRRGGNAAKTHCIRGHPFDEANTYRPPGRPDQRRCRACKDRRNAHARNERARKRNERARQRAMSQ